MPRERQIAIAARIVKALARFSAGRAVLRRVQTLPATAPAYRTLLGYRRPFASLSEARAAIADYTAQGHESERNVQHHLELSSAARPSDYAAVFHLRPLAAELRTVFDLGGNAGNLFYCYSRYLPLRVDLRWTELALPVNMAAGEKLARERGATALHFAAGWQEASGVDLLLVSGSLHYLETPLPEMIAALAIKPAHILINRTPLTDGAPVAAVQVASGFRLACMLYNRTRLLGQLETLGYTVVDQWKAAELSMEIPGYPEHAIPAYSGAYLRRNEQ